MTVWKALFISYACLLCCS